MDQNVGFLQCVSDEWNGLIEILAHIEFFMVLSWNVKLEGDLSFGMVKEHAFCCSQYGFDSIFYITQKVLFRVLRFWAASKLPTKIPPFPLIGSWTHSISSGYTIVPLGSLYIDFFLFRIKIYYCLINFYYIGILN